MASGKVVSFGDSSLVSAASASCQSDPMFSSAYSLFDNHGTMP
jgi:hypothetical protein